MKYFYKDIELLIVWGEAKDVFYSIGGKANKFNYYDSFKRLVGKDAQGNLYPVQRKINYSKHPSLHKCDGRCVNARGGNCECSCGGVNHGIGNV